MNGRRLVASPRKGEIMTQEKKLLTYLQGHKSISRYEAMNHLHILNLPQVVRKLRMAGHNIVSNTCKNRKGEHWTEYSLES